MKLIYRSLMVVALIGLGVWSALVFLLSPGLPLNYRTPAAAVTAILVVLSVIPWGRRTLSRSALIAVVCGAVVLWIGLNPSNDRNWAPEVKNAPWAEVVGDDVTIHNVRNFSYRTESDFDANYDTRSFKVSELTEVDMVVTYWAGKAIAHLMVSFGFNNRDFIAFSIETRKEVGESYSAVGGFFRNYELTYVVADERDVIGVRTNHRVPEEQVYVLRTRMALENGRKLFLQYIEKINALREKPAFYNTFTTNCTTQVLALVQALGAVAHYDWKILLSGYVPEYLYEGESLMPGMTLEQIMAASLVNEASKRSAGAPNFSALIRDGVPHPEPRARPLSR